MQHQPLSFREVAQAIGQSRSGALSCGTISKHLSRGENMVRRALEQMEAAGCVAPRGGTFVLTGQDVPAGGIIPSRSIREDFTVTPMEDDGPFSRNETARAERLWRQRMGDQRFHDDARLRSDRHWGGHLLPAWR
jgi:hypothetical protein